MKTYEDYIIVIKPNRRTSGKLTDIALRIKDMDINKDISSNDFQAEWFNPPTAKGNLKVWRKRNYTLSPAEITTCSDLEKQGISTSLESGNKIVCANSGWGQTIDTNGKVHRIVYCYEENILKIIQYGFFDKTNSMFKKADEDSLRLAS